MPQELAPIAFAFLFVPFWCLICYGISRSGWNTLVEKYPSRGIVPQSRNLFCSFVLNKYVNYNGCVQVGFMDTGLYMKVLPLFPFHEPVFIPYEEFRATGESRSLWFEAFTVGEPKVAEIAFGPFISKRLKEKLSSHRE